MQVSPELRDALALTGKDLPGLRKALTAPQTGVTTSSGTLFGHELLQWFFFRLGIISPSSRLTLSRQLVKNGILIPVKPTGREFSEGEQYQLIAEDAVPMAGSDIKRSGGATSYPQVPAVPIDQRAVEIDDIINITPSRRMSMEEHRLDAEEEALMREEEELRKAEAELEARAQLGAGMVAPPPVGLPPPTEFDAPPPLPPMPAFGFTPLPPPASALPPLRSPSPTQSVSPYPLPPSSPIHTLMPVPAPAPPSPTPVRQPPASLYASLPIGIDTASPQPSGYSSPPMSPKPPSSPAPPRGSRDPQGGSQILSPAAARGSATGNGSVVARQSPGSSAGAAVPKGGDGKTLSDSKDKKKDAKEAKEKDKKKDKKEKDAKKDKKDKGSGVAPPPPLSISSPLPFPNPPKDPNQPPPRRMIEVHWPKELTGLDDYAKKLLPEPSDTVGKLLQKTLAVQAVLPEAATCVRAEDWGLYYPRFESWLDEARVIASLDLRDKDAIYLRRRSNPDGLAAEATVPDVASIEKQYRQQADEMLAKITEDKRREEEERRRVSAEKRRLEEENAKRAEEERKRAEEERKRAAEVEEKRRWDEVKRQEDKRKMEELEAILSFDEERRKRKEAEDKKRADESEARARAAEMRRKLEAESAAAEEERRRQQEIEDKRREAQRVAEERRREDERRREEERRRDEERRKEDERRRAEAARQAAAEEEERKRAAQEAATAAAIAVPPPATAVPARMAVATGERKGTGAPGPMLKLSGDGERKGTGPPGPMVKAQQPAAGGANATDLVSRYFPGRTASPTTAGAISALPKRLNEVAGGGSSRGSSAGEPAPAAATAPATASPAPVSPTSPTITARSAFTAGRGSAGSESPTPSPVPVAVAKAPLPTTAPSLGPGEAAPPTTGSGRVVPPSPLAQQAAAPRTSPQNSSGNLLNAPAGSGRASTAGAQPVTQFQPGLRSSTAGTGASTGTGPSVPLALRGTAIGDKRPMSPTLSSPTSTQPPGTPPSRIPSDAALVSHGTPSPGPIISKIPMRTDTPTRPNGNPAMGMSRQSAAGAAAKPAHIIPVATEVKREASPLRGTSPQGIRKSGSPGTSNRGSPPAPATAAPATVAKAASAPAAAAAPRTMAELLIKLDMAPYVDVFEKEEIDLSTAVLMNDEQLAELGLPIGKRLRLMSAFKSMTQQKSPADELTRLQEIEAAERRLALEKQRILEAAKTRQAPV